MSSRSLHRGATAALVVVAMCAAVALSEAAFRVVKRVVCVTAGAKLFRPHPRYGWTHEPGAEGWTNGCIGRAFEWRAFSRINAEGLRDEEHAWTPTQGVTRILLLGDSFVEAMQVPLEKTFAKRLEAKLNDDGRRVEVVNAGVSAFDTDNELLFFDSDGRRYRPDVVLLAFTEVNDVTGASKHLFERMYVGAPEGPPPKPHFKIGRDGGLRLDMRAVRRSWEEFTARRASVLGRAGMALERNLHVVRLVESAISRRAPRADAPRIMLTTILGIYAQTPTRAWEDAWALTRALLRRLQHDVDATGAAFAAVLIPPKEVVSPEAWRSLRALAPEHAHAALDVDRPGAMSGALFAELGVPYLDLAPPLRSHFATTGRSGYFAWDVHLTEEGHEVVAEALRPFVERLVDARAR
jgi:lysophospholipase L1-like esterase